MTVAFFLTIPLNQVLSAPFLVTWGMPNALSGGAGVTVDSSGEIFVVGGTGPTGTLVDFSVLILKYSLNGGLLWQKLWGGPLAPKDDFGSGITVDSSGNVYVTGGMSENGGAFLLKLNATGDLLRYWVLSNQTYGKTVLVSPAGEIYWIVNTLYRINDSLILLRFNAQGRLISRIWKQGLAGSATLDQAGNIYVSGTTSSNGLLLKFNATGTLVWQRTWRFNSSYQETGDGVVTDSAGNVYVAGSSHYGNPRCPECPVLILASVSKFDPNGTLLWHRANIASFPGGFNAIAGLVPTAIAASATNHVFIAGNGYSTDASYAFAMELDSSGSLISFVSWDGTVASGIAVDPSGNAVVIGTAYERPHSLSNPKPTFNNSLPTEAIPAGVIQNTTILVQNAPYYPFLGPHLSNVVGNTTFVGAYDVFLNSGLLFPVPTLGPQQTLTLGATLVTISAIYVLLARKRSVSRR